MVNRCLVFIFSCTLVLAGPWEDFVQTRRRQAYPRNRWTLCVKASLLSPGDLLRDTEYQKVATGGDWGVEILGTAQAQDLEAVHGAQWALLGPGGDVAGTGAGRPDGARLLSAIHASGAKARWEARAAFLKENPTQGDALLEELGQALRLLRAQVASLDSQGKVKVPAWHPVPGAPPPEERITLAGAEGDAKADELYAGVQDALQRLSQAPQWTREAQWVASRIALFDLGQSTSMRGLLARLAQEVEAAAAAEPQDPHLSATLMELLDGARLLPETLAGTILPVPGTLWPSQQAVPSLLEPYRRRRNLDGELRLIADLTPMGPPEPLTPRGWEEYCGLKSTLLAHRAAALASQGSWDEARASLDESMKWGGSRGAQVALLRRRIQDRGGDAATWRRLGAHATTGPTQLPPAPRMPQPLRLTLLGRPSWLLDWTALRDAPELATWAPGELQWDIAAPAVHAELRARYGWDADPRWALFRGEELLAAGQAFPGPKALAATLASHGMPMLERMARVLARNPDHAATRKARFQLLQARMPDPRLEPLMVEDAARARLPLPFGPKEAWKPDEALWSAAAQTVLPELEQVLRSWPSDPDLWQAWISWARFHPARPSILALAQGLPFWVPAGDWRTTLPYAVHRAVAVELRRQGDFMAMRDWFQASWDVLDHRPLKDLRPWEKAATLDLRGEEETAIYQPLREALRALGLNEQLLDLERVFGAMMGRDAGRRR